jgi:hypothetical protein
MLLHPFSERNLLSQKEELFDGGKRGEGIPGEFCSPTISMPKDDCEIDC